MIFKFFKQDKTQPEDLPAETAAEAVPEPVVPVAANDAIAPETAAASVRTGSGAPAGMLGADDLRRETDAALWGGLGSDEIEPLGCTSAQQEALAGIGLALGGAPVEAGFVLMPSGGGLWSQLSEHARSLAAERSVPADWVYVAALNGDRRLLALPLPPGRGRSFAVAIAAALDELAATVPAALSADEFTLRRQTIAEEVRISAEQPLEDLRVRAKAQNVAMLRTPAGYTLAPMHEGKVVRPELFAQLPTSMQREVEARIGALERELETLLEASAGAERTRRCRILELEAEAVRPHIAAALSEVKSQLTDADEAASLVSALEEELIAKAAVVAREDTAQPGLKRYEVSIVAARPNAQEEAPFVEAVQPTRERLAGTVHGGVVVPGLLHRAYGGVLLVDARDLAADAGAREAITAALRTRHVLPCASGNGPVADPIPLALTVIIAGDRDALDRLTDADAGLGVLAPVVADLTRSVARTPETESEAARVIAAQVREAGLTPLGGGALARLVEECARLSGRRDRLLVGSECVVRLAAEAGARARRSGRTTASREDAAAAIAARSARTLRDGSANITFGVPSVGRVVTAACASGQMPSTARLLARCGPAQGRGGRISLTPHPREPSGFALSSYLSGRFGAEPAAGLAAVLSVEGPAEALGDPLAGAARLAALLSSLADIPVSQKLAVIGDIDAGGALMAAAGLDAAIECVYAAGSDEDGPDGVIVPEAACGRLMLCEAVTGAVAAGRLVIATAETIDDVMSLLTGAKETPETLHERMATRLESLAARRV